MFYLILLLTKERKDPLYLNSDYRIPKLPK